jgi:hypothetical protein
MYLREMRSVQLLSREGEVAIAKRIEAGREMMLGAIRESPLMFDAVLGWRDAFNQGKMLLRDIIDLDATYGGGFDRAVVFTGSNNRRLLAGPALSCLCSQISSLRLLESLPCVNRSDLAALSARGSAGSAYATSCARARCRANLAFGSALQPDKSPSRNPGLDLFYRSLQASHETVHAFFPRLRPGASTLELGARARSGISRRGLFKDATPG